MTINEPLANNTNTNNNIEKITENAVNTNYKFVTSTKYHIQSPIIKCHQTKPSQKRIQDCLEQNLDDNNKNSNNTQTSKIWETTTKNLKQSKLSFVSQSKIKPIETANDSTIYNQIFIKTQQTQKYVINHNCKYSNKPKPLPINSTKLKILARKGGICNNYNKPITLQSIIKSQSVGTNEILNNTYLTIPHYDKMLNRRKPIPIQHYNSISSEHNIRNMIKKKHKQLIFQYNKKKKN